MTLPHRSFPQNCYYSIHGTDHAIRHALSLLSVIRNAILSREGLESDSLFAQHVIWLLDSLFALFQLRPHWRSAVDISSMDFIDFALGVASAHGNARGLNTIIYHKLYSLLALICAGVAENPKDILRDGEYGEKAKHSLCVAFIHLAKAAIKHKPISKLIKGQLLAPLKILTTENISYGPGTDFWVGALCIVTVCEANSC